jgi:hypothetical protein
MKTGPLRGRFFHGAKAVFLKWSPKPVFFGLTVFCARGDDFRVARTTAGGIKAPPINPPGNSPVVFPAGPDFLSIQNFNRKIRQYLIHSRYGLNANP